MIIKIIRWHPTLHLLPFGKYTFIALLTCPTIIFPEISKQCFKLLEYEKRSVINRTKGMNFKSSYYDNEKNKLIVTYKSFRESFKEDDVILYEGNNLEEDIGNSSLLFERDCFKLSLKGDFLTENNHNKVFSFSKRFLDDNNMIIIYKNLIT